MSQSNMYIRSHNPQTGIIPNWVLPNAQKCNTDVAVFVEKIFRAIVGSKNYMAPADVIFMRYGEGGSFILRLLLVFLTSLAWRCENLFAHQPSPSPSHSPLHCPFTPVEPGYGDD
jgi:hypothetical protein